MSYINELYLSPRLSPCHSYRATFALLRIVTRLISGVSFSHKITKMSIQFLRCKYIFSQNQHVRKQNVGILESVKRKRRRSDPVLWQNPLHQQKIRKPKDNTQTPQKTSITQRLRTDLGRSVGVTSHPTGVVKPVYGYPTFPLTAKAV